MKPLQTRMLQRRACILLILQGLLVHPLLLDIAEHHAQQRGGQRVKQQQHPPGPLDKGVTGPVGNLRERGQLHQLHHHAQQEVVDQPGHMCAPQPPLPRQHTEQGRQHHHGDAHHRPAAAQLVAVQRRHRRRNGGHHTAAHHTGHGQHNRAAIKQHPRRKMHRIDHAQQRHPAKQQAQQNVPVQRIGVLPRNNNLPRCHQGNQKGDVVDEVGKHGVRGEMKPEWPKQRKLSARVAKTQATPAMTRLRPSALAWYRALSASAIRRASDSALSVCVATPMLTVKRTVSP